MLQDREDERTNRYTAGYTMHQTKFRSSVRPSECPQGRHRDDADTAQNIRKAHARKGYDAIRCDLCPRRFRDSAALRTYQASVKHNPMCLLRCHLSAACGETFPCCSALFHHLEGGRCKSGMTQITLNTLLLELKEQRGVLSWPRDWERLLLDLVQATCDRSRWGVGVGYVYVPSPTNSTFTDMEMASAITGSTSASSGIVILAPQPANLMPPTDSWEEKWVALYESGQLPPDRVPSSESRASQSWICSHCNRNFRREKDLRQHSNSIAHTAGFLLCPTRSSAGERSPGKSFKTLSGLLQHMESGACEADSDVLSSIVSLLQAKQGMEGI